MSRCVRVHGVTWVAGGAAGCKGPGVRLLAVSGVTVPVPRFPPKLQKRFQLPEVLHVSRTPRRPFGGDQRREIKRSEVNIARTYGCAAGPTVRVTSNSWHALKEIDGSLRGYQREDLGISEGTGVHDEWEAPVDASRVRAPARQESGEARSIPGRCLETYVEVVGDAGRAMGRAGDAADGNVPDAGFGEALHHP